MKRMFSVDCGSAGSHWLSPSVSIVMMSFINLCRTRAAPHGPTGA
jgi:hypothetical protein